MPRYEFFCHVCGKPFSKVLTLQQHQEGRFSCPHCGSVKSEQRLSSFYTAPIKKTA